MENGNDNERPGAPFKSCPHCGHAWSTRDALLADPEVELIGYQSWLPDPELGMLLLNHEPCGTTLALEASHFTDLYDGPVFAERLAGTDDCSGQCQAWDRLDPCPQQCECAYVREVLQIVREWPKPAEPPE